MKGLLTALPAVGLAAVFAVEVAAQPGEAPGEMPPGQNAILATPSGRPVSASAPAPNKEADEPGPHSAESLARSGDITGALHELDDRIRAAVGNGGAGLIAQASPAAADSASPPPSAAQPAASPSAELLGAPPETAASADSPPPAAPSGARAEAPAPSDAAPALGQTSGSEGGKLPDGEAELLDSIAEQDQDGQSATRQALTSTPTGNIVVNLIGKLVEKGILSPQDAETMVVQAQAEAEAQKAQSESDMFAIAQIAAVQTMTDQALAEQKTPSPLEASREAMRVSYIPAPVRDQITEEVRRKLAADGFGSGSEKIPPGLLETLARLKPEGEIRMRFEANLYPEGNDNTGAFPNFNAINTGAPFDVTGTEFAPQWNVDQNRTRFRLLARFGLGIDLGDNFSAGLRMGTGDNNSPVSANQSMGLANQAQGGQFSDYALWLERAYIRYDLGGGEDSGAFTFWAGRFDNPFFSTPIIFDEDLGFDGVALRLGYNYRNTIMPSLVAGAFPVFNTDLNFSSNQPEKFASYDKYLFAVQAGTEINFSRHWNGKFAAAYYNFYNVEGQLSSPFVPLSPDDAGDTDNSRPSFAQKGNTYMPLRDIMPDPSNDFGAINQWQYFGLATPFENFVLTGELNYDGFEPVRVSVVGEFVQNMAFNSDQINEVAVNNRGSVVADDPDIDTSSVGDFEGEGYAWLIDLVVGHAELDRAGAWQMSLGYRYIGSDAVVDGFNDSDFGLGGSNMKGFTAAARFALNPHVYVGLRWFGAESIAGPQFDMNIFQFDLGAKF